MPLTSFRLSAKFPPVSLSEKPAHCGIGNLPLDAGSAIVHVEIQEDGPLLTEIEPERWRSLKGRTEPEILAEIAGAAAVIAQTAQQLGQLRDRLTVTKPLHFAWGNQTVRFMAHVPDDLEAPPDTPAMAAE